MKYGIVELLKDVVLGGIYLSLSSLMFYVSYEFISDADLFGCLMGIFMFLFGVGVALIGISFYTITFALWKQEIIAIFRRKSAVR